MDLRKLLYILGTLAVMVILDGVLFYILEWRHSDTLLIIGFALFTLVFAPLYAYYRFQNRKL
ncbi:MAG: multisubunit Na+/H+ antiporter MnhG subunit [Flavobacteriales bacterium]|jgi:multisubunit Na+/H+ antiporter MnhG subunit